MLLAYAWHALRAPYPLLQLTLLRVRTLRVSLVGGFLTRLGVGGMPFLLPLLYQVGMGLPAWQSGLLMMPAAAAAMGMKVLATALLRRFGFRRVLTVNTVLVGCTIACFSLVQTGTSLTVIVGFGLLMGLFNSLQYSAMNTIAFADIPDKEAAMASTIVSTAQQMSMSFGLALGSLVAGFYLADRPQTDPAAVTQALHYAFLTLAMMTALCSLSFWTLKVDDGDNVSRGAT